MVAEVGIHVLIHSQHETETFQRQSTQYTPLSFHLLSSFLQFVPLSQNTCANAFTTQSQKNTTAIGQLEPQSPRSNTLINIILII